MARVHATFGIERMASYLTEDTSAVESRRAEIPPDLHAAYGIGVGVLLGVVAWVVISPRVSRRCTGSNAN
jgi:hypothetical protein